MCLSHGAGIKRLGKYSREEEERKNGLWRGEKDGVEEKRGKTTGEEKKREGIRIRKNEK